MITVINADCIEGMRTLPDESVHLIVTSPPYWNLRNYNVVGQIGLEASIEEYLAKIVEVFREARRVLRKDGTLWVNMGDSYFGDSPTRSKSSEAFSETWDKSQTKGRGGLRRSAARMGSLKPGDLCGIPWRVAFALQEDGWHFRRDNIWFKSNPMPESVNGWRWEQHRIKGERTAADWKVRPKGWQAGEGAHDKIADGNYRKNGEEQTVVEMVVEMVDCPGCAKCTPNGGLILRKGNWRCTTSHEYVFQFSKSDSYFCDAEAAREKSAERPSGNKKRFIAEKSGDRGRINNHLGSAIPYQPNSSGRNRRSVWTITTKPYKEAHFATFPPNLVRPIIQAASPVKCCSACGAPWAPVVERGEPNRAQQLACGSDANGEYLGTATKDFAANGAEDASAVKARILAGMVTKTVIDHRPTCRCNASAKPSTVLDMFGGSGTTAQVAGELGRDSIIIELNSEYIPLIHKRTQSPGLAL